MTSEPSRSLSQSLHAFYAAHGTKQWAELLPQQRDPGAWEQRIRPRLQQLTDDEVSSSQKQRLRQDLRELLPYMPLSLRDRVEPLVCLSQ